MTRGRQQDYVDVGFESTLDHLYELVSRLRHSKHRNELAANEDLINRVCRLVRVTKLEFYKVVESYDSYKDQCQDYIDLVEEAAEIAADGPFRKVSKSLARHSVEIQNCQAEFKERSSANYRRGVKRATLKKDAKPKSGVAIPR